MVNTEHNEFCYGSIAYYNILNIVVNTEPRFKPLTQTLNYNILNIVVNTER